MRLFTAINFDEPTKDTLTDIIHTLKDAAHTGSFTSRQNLHLTLVFIGEVAQPHVHDIKIAMERIEEKPFILDLGGTGSFVRDSGEIFWVGAYKSRALLSVRDQLNERLVQAGCAVEMREFKPHLTLARELSLDAGFDREHLAKEVGAIRMPVKSIDLMRSERIDGVLTYTRIHSKWL
ncbi:MAG: RNA 2',3'-cyclic phosphodiesterase [Acetanaerobacterium sp.]